MGHKNISESARRNFVYSIITTQTSPTGRGSKREWLEYYKLNPELNEAYVFLDMDGVEPEAGDTLWFQVDDQIIACVTVRSTFFDPARALYELWYKGSEIQRIDGVRTEERGTRIVSPEAPWISSVRTTQSAGVS